MSVIFADFFQINQPKTATVASSRKSTSQVRRLSKDQKFTQHESLRLASHLEKNVGVENFQAHQFKWCYSTKELYIKVIEC